MKNLFTLLGLTLLGVTTLYAQNPDEGDSTFVQGWTGNAISWVSLPATEPVRAEALATPVTAFDAAGSDFDVEWAKIPGDGNVLGGDGHILGLAASNKGAEDFKDAAFKIVYDESNIYVLLKYTDDDVTGTETVEIAWAPYLAVNAPAMFGAPVTQYMRYVEFGAYKATFKTTGFDAAMMVTGATASINWGGTNEVLTPNLFLDDHTAIGAKTIKQIYTIGFAALTGLARPEFTPAIWAVLNEGKGISFDMKVNDVDADDALDGTPEVQKPAEYWWNTTHNDAYALTTYAGLVGIKLPVDAGDAAFTSTWTGNALSWVSLPATEPVRVQASAAENVSFDPAAVDFDAAWNSIVGDGNALGAEGHILGLAGSNKGANDFTDAAFKVVYDASNMYVLLQYTDDDVTGTETVEIAWAPYLAVNAPAMFGAPVTQYMRYVEFGAYKATFKTTGFDAAMMVTGAPANVNWGGTNEILTANLFIDDHTAIGSKTIKHIYTIGYPALTGAARPEFTPAIWASLNGGKGISFDLKVNDVDADDALDGTPAVQKPAEYWWNTTNNDVYALTTYAGLLDTKGVMHPVGISDNKVKSTIFSLVTPDQIQFSVNANVAVYNTLGQLITMRKNVRQIELSGLEKGIYIIRANNESRKIIR